MFYITRLSHYSTDTGQMSIIKFVFFIKKYSRNGGNPSGESLEHHHFHFVAQNPDLYLIRHLGNHRFFQFIPGL